MSVVINESAMNNLLYGETGPIAMFIDRKARRVNELAAANATGRPGPNIRSYNLVTSIRYPGIIATPEGPYAWIGTDARSPRQNFNYPRALEIGMPEFARLPFIDERTKRATTRNTGIIQKGYHYPFLRPALQEAFREI